MAMISEPEEGPLLLLFGQGPEEDIQILYRAVLYNTILEMVVPHHHLVVRSCLRLLNFFARSRRLINQTGRCINFQQIPQENRYVVEPVLFFTDYKIFGESCLSE